MTFCPTVSTCTVATVVTTSPGTGILDATPTFHGTISPTACTTGRVVFVKAGKVVVGHAEPTTVTPATTYDATSATTALVSSFDVPISGRTSTSHGRGRLTTAWDYDGRTLKRSYYTHFHQSLVLWTKSTSRNLTRSQYGSCGSFYRANKTGSTPRPHACLPNHR